MPARKNTNISHGLNHGEHVTEEQEAFDIDHDERAGVHLYTLGQFTVTLPTPAGPRSPTWRDDRTRQLLKCLVAAPGYYLTRDQLIELLWPDQDVFQGRELLRSALSRLRRTLEPSRAAYDQSPFVASDHDVVWLVREHAADPEPCMWVDRDQFERQALRALHLFDQAHDAARLELAHRIAEQALELYGGTFLPTDTYVDWTHTVRAQCQQLWTAVLRRLADMAVAQRKFDHALLLLGQLVAATPDDEGAVSLLMRILAATGRRAEALRRYHLLCVHLATSLGTNPIEDLQYLAAAIRSGGRQHDMFALLPQ